jgi:hypothetical protein
MSKLRSEYIAPDFFAARVLFRQEPEQNEEEDEEEEEDEDRDEDGDDSQDDDEGYSP